MNRSQFVFTSESVAEGHPDKVCDRISDTLLDAFLSRDSEARVACETFATTDRVIVGGEVRLKGGLDRESCEGHVREAIRDLGHDQPGFDWRTVRIEILLQAQSPDIARGVDARDDKPLGAGDQGIMFGYACRESESLMPAPIHCAHAILRTLASRRKRGDLPQLGPDAKCQVSVAYEASRPVGVSTLVLSTQHVDPEMRPDAVRSLIEPVVRQSLPEGWLTDKTAWHVNPTGKFVVGGPQGDAGLTGRKIIVDTYGGAAPHGGGAFSGKDPTKVDRSGAYAARFLAKNIVAARLADACTLQLAYAIGISRPVSMYLELKNAVDMDISRFEHDLLEAFDLTPAGIRALLNLNRPIYAATSAYGHFGREPQDSGEFSWERLTAVDTLRSLASAAG